MCHVLRNRVVGKAFNVKEDESMRPASYRSGSRGKNKLKVGIGLPCVLNGSKHPCSFRWNDLIEPIYKQGQCAAPAGISDERVKSLVPITCRQHICDKRRQARVVLLRSRKVTGGNEYRTSWDLSSKELRRLTVREEAKKGSLS